MLIYIYYLNNLTFCLKKHKKNLFYWLKMFCVIKELVTQSRRLLLIFSRQQIIS